MSTYVKFFVYFKILNNKIIIAFNFKKKTTDGFFVSRSYSIHFVHN